MQITIHGSGVDRYLGERECVGVHVCMRVVCVCVCVWRERGRERRRQGACESDERVCVLCESVYM